MTAMVGGVGPVRESERFEVMDVLRGFALCGILLMNIPYMALFSEPGHPALPVSQTSDWMVWFTQGLVFEGTMRGLFTLLFGAGMVLMTMRGDREHGSIGVADVYFRRSVILILLGIVNFTLLAWPGDILYSYGFAALFLFMFRRLRPIVLFVLAGLLIAFLTVGGGFDAKGSADRYIEGSAAVAAQARGEALSEDQQGVAESYQEAQTLRAPTDESRAQERDARSSYASAIGWSVGEWGKYGMGFFMIILIVESIAFMFIGVGLFKMGVITGERSMGFYAVMLAVCYAIGLSVNGWEMVTLWNANLDPVVWRPNVTYEIGRLAMTLGHLSLVIILWKANVLGFIGTGLKAIGRMALTNYLAQSLSTSVLFYGLGYFAAFDWLQLWGIAAAIWVAQAIISLLWLRVFAMGPVEWLLRCASYARWQPITRAAGRPPETLQPSPVA